MSYDEKTDRMNWNDEIVWFGISSISGTLLSSLFLFFDKFPKTSNIPLSNVAFLGSISLAFWLG